MMKGTDLEDGANVATETMMREDEGSIALFEVEIQIMREDVNRGTERKSTTMSRISTGQADKERQIRAFGEVKVCR